ncbi:MAG: Crp/Fnr family transcriptional regulator [Flavobacteriales bacterium]|nr:Crp/Fnr family transcriptional regulator [Flavobacteriales bacterium]
MRLKRIEMSCDQCAVNGLSMFNHLCGSSIEGLEKNKSCTLYKKNQVVFHEGTRPLGIFCINAGKVKVYKTGAEGKDQIIQILSPGDMMGYRSMLSEEPYPVSAETLEDTSICFIPKSDFLEVLKVDSELTNRILKSMSKELGAMADSITTLAQKPVRERLAGALLMLKDTYGMDAHDNGEVEINLTREDLANIVGTATETLIRLLHDFKEEKLIQTQGRKIRVLDSQKLMRVANLY